MRELKANRVLCAALCTMAFVMTAQAIHAQTFTVLSKFDPTNNGPWDAQIQSIIAQGQDGNLYFTTLNGGDSNNETGGIFQMTPSGMQTLVASFGPFVANEPRNPSGLTVGMDGNFYGTTILGGFGTMTDFGTVFQVTPQGAVTFLYSFSGGGDGGHPYAPPIQANDGNFYGTTAGTGAVSNVGTVYQLTPAGVLTTLYAFDSSQSIGAFPFAPLVQGTDGNLYGTASAGGPVGCGIIFKITLGGQFTVLHNFPVENGCQPDAPLIQGNDGNFYGTLRQSGNTSSAVFKISPAGKLKILRETAGSTDGWIFEAGLTLGSDGLFYGAAQLGGASNNGTIFRINSIGKSFLVLHDFDGTNGSQPQVTLTQHTSGVFFGDTSGGGNDLCQPSGFGCGVFYSLDASIKPFAGLLSNFGPVGSTVGILGQGFTGTKKVIFAGGSAVFTVVSDTYLTATVPAGAKTGFVTVRTPSGSLRSSRKFVVTP